MRKENSCIMIDNQGVLKAHSYMLRAEKDNEEYRKMII